MRKKQQRNNHKKILEGLSEWYLEKLTVEGIFGWKLILRPVIIFIAFGILTILAYIIYAIVEQDFEDLFNIVLNNIKGWGLNAIITCLVGILTLLINVIVVETIITPRFGKLIGKIRQHLRDKVVFGVIYFAIVIWILYIIIVLDPEFYFYLGKYNLFSISSQIRLSMGVFYGVVLLNFLLKPPFPTVGDFLEVGDYIATSLKNDLHFVLGDEKEIDYDKIFILWQKTIEFFEMLDTMLLDRINIGVNNINEISANIMMIYTSNKKKDIQYIVTRIIRIINGIKTKNFVNVIENIVEIDEKAKEGAEPFERAIYFKPSIDTTSNKNSQGRKFLNWLVSFINGMVILVTAILQIINTVK